MTALSPRAQAFVEQTLQSAALHQKHRAQIWAQLQQRVLAESTEPNSHRWSALRSPLGWVSCAIASVALAAGVLGVAHRRDHSPSAISADTCPALPAPSCAACLAPNAPELQLPQTPPAALSVVSQQSTANRSKAKRRAAQAVARVSPANRLPVPVQLPANIVVASLPSYAGPSYDNRRERLEIAPQWGGAPLPLAESRFESSPPLKLTPPQFKLTAMVLE